MIITQGTLQTLFVAFNAAFREGFGQAPTDHERIAMMVSSMTSTEEYAWLGQWPGLKEWVGERVIRSLIQHEYSIKNKTFESTIGVQRDRIRDDQYGVYTPMFSELGRATAAHPTELVYEALVAGFDTKCFDGQYFFDTDHPIDQQGDGGIQANRPAALGNGKPWFLIDTSRAIKPIIHQTREAYDLTRMDDPTDENVFMRREFLYGVDGRCNVGYGLWQLAWGSKQPLTAAAYAEARAAMHVFKADSGRPLGIMPRLLVVDPSQEKAALELINAERLANGATNVWRGTVDVLQSPWLEAA
ncbi:MAG: hypothetical protein F4X99_23440 [Gammaproteobacteria bacterium]|nr:hypothetical protein [Gammaproteobacteria bacterium]